MDPILSAMLSAAARSITSITIQSSLPKWREAVRGSIFESSAIKNLPEWEAIKADRQRSARLQKFLASREALGSLEAYAISYASQFEEDGSVDAHRAVFVETLVKHLKAPRTAEIDSLADRLWERLTATVRLGLAGLRRSGTLDTANLILFAKLTQHPKDSKSAIGANVEDRLAIVGSGERMAAILDAVGRVRRGSLNYFSEMQMPHSQDAFRIKSDDLYIRRELSNLAIDWVQSSRDSLFLKSTGDTVAESEVSERRCVIVGNPGVGKSTMMRRLLFDICTDGDSELAPMLLEVKAWVGSTRSLLAMLTERLASTIQEDVSEAELSDLLTLGLGIVVFDGIDEVVEIGKRRQLVSAIEAFAIKYPLCRIIVSSRVEGFAAVRLDSILFPALQIPEFNPPEVDSYVAKWFSLVFVLDAERAESFREGFMADSVSAAELRSNPLMLSLLCILYQSKKHIPENRLSVYEACANLLFSRWDHVRDVPSLLTKEVRRHHLVEELAYRIFKLRLSREVGEREGTLRRYVTDYFLQNVTEDRFEASAEADIFLQHCTGRAWLLARVGLAASGERLFDFTHRTFLEYFAACRIARFAASAIALVSEVRPLLSQGSSAVIVQLAILRYDERVADGANSVIRLLLFDSPTLEQRYSTSALRFLAGSADSLHLTPRTRRSLMHAILREYSKSSSASDIGAVVNISAEFRDELQGFARSLIRRKSDDPIEAEAFDGARKLTRRDNSNTRDPRWLLRHNQKTLIDRLMTSEITASRYRSVAGDGCLVDVGLRYNRSLANRVPGPIVAGIRVALASGLHPVVLDELFRIAAADPAALFPISRAAVVELYEALEEVDDWTLESVYGARRPVERQPLAGFCNVAVAMTLGAFDYGIEDALDFGAEKCLGFQNVEGLDLSRAALRGAIVESRAIHLSEPWRNALRDWAVRDSPRRLYEALREAD